MHRIIKLTSAVLALALLISPAVAEAHVLKTDNGYSAVMHIDPDDEPLANEPTVLNFQIGNGKGDLLQTDYKITVAIAAGGKTLQTIPVEPASFGDASNGIASYTFPALNVYTLTLHGQRNSNGASAFTMSYVVRVAGSATGAGATAASDKTDGGAQVLILSAGSLAVLGLIGFTVIRQGKRYVAKPKTGGVAAH